MVVDIPGNRAQSSSFAPLERDAPRITTSGISRGENYLYEITSFQKKDDSPDVVTGIIKVFTFNVYSLLDRGESLYFVTPYLANLFEILSEKICEHFCVFYLF